MRFNKLDLNLLVALDALLTEQNITRAAERLHLSQSAMSNALSRLREYFEDELLVQVGRKMEPTPRAQTLQEAVRDVLLRIDTSIAAMPQFDYTMATLLPHVLALAARQRSTVRFKLLPQVASPARSLERGEADILVIPKAYCSPDHPAEVILEEDHVCVVWSQSTAARAGMSFERYAEAGHVVMVPTESGQPAFEGWFVQRFGLSRRIAVTAYSFAALPFLVVGTELVATVHARLARSLAASLPITILPVPLPIPKLEQAMQWHKYRASDPGLMWLRQLLKDAAAAMHTADANQAVSSLDQGQP
jgi:LysR family transcriptional regulator, nod-box dependent transcriptional activator